MCIVHTSDFEYLDIYKMCMVHRVEIFRKDSGIVGQQFLKVSDIPNRFFELPKLKILMYKLCKILQIQSHSSKINIIKFLLRSTCSNQSHKHASIQTTFQANLGIVFYN